MTSPSLRAVDVWCGASVVLGLFLIWIAVASPIASDDAESLTVHMVQHLLLMSLAPPLIWLGEPVRALPARLVRLFQQRPIRQLGALLGNPVVCWLAGTAALIGWHVPAALALGMRSDTWHAIELASFVAAGLLFWWPVVRPWPASPEPRWSIVLYLFLATLPCDILAGLLVFSERVAYPAYLSHRHGGHVIANPADYAGSVLGDQQFAGALMWTAVTIIYVVAAAIVSTRLLSGSGIRFTNARTTEAA
jgi:cytochrome c oxidase assembly factor CtaG